MRDVALQAAAVAEAGSHVLPWWAWTLIGLAILIGLVVWIRGWNTDIDTNTYN